MRDVRAGAATAVGSGARWRSWRIEVPDVGFGRRLVAAELAPLLERLNRNGSVRRWWFLVKHDGAAHVRLRLLPADAAGGVTDAVEAALDVHREAGRVQRWCAVPYEPETVLFGGLVGIDLAHDLMHRDSVAAARWLAEERDHTQEASVIAIRALLTGADLDVFEQGDVWSRVADHRPIDAGRLEPVLARNLDAVGRLYLAPTDEVRELVGAGAWEVLDAWAVELHRSGRELAAAARAGQLGRGQRAILATFVVFHWNRLGLSAAVQAGLAHLVASWIFHDDRGPLRAGRER